MSQLGADIPRFSTQQQRAFDFVLELTKQLITLAIGVTTLTVLFVASMLDDTSGALAWALVVGWVTYLFSIIFGVVTMMALAATLEPKPPPRLERVASKGIPARSRHVAAPSIWNTSIVSSSKVQIFVFAAGTIAVIVAGAIAAFGGASGDAAKDELLIACNALTNY